MTDYEKELEDELILATAEITQLHGAIYEFLHIIEQQANNRFHTPERDLSRYYMEKAWKLGLTEYLPAYKE